MNKKVNIFKITAVFLIILAAVFYYYEEIKAPEIEEIPKANIVVVAQDVPDNTVITKDMVLIEQRYVDDIKQSNFGIDINSIIGMRTLTPLYKGEILSTNRLTENKSYMNTEKQTHIAISLVDADKVLEYEKGDYIDIWLEPIPDGNEVKQVGPDDNGVLIPIISEAHRLFQKLMVVDLHDANFYQIEKKENIANLNTTDTDVTGTEVYIPAYITVQLSNDSIKELLEIDKTKYNIRVTKYGEEKKYGVIQDVLKKSSTEMEDIEGE